MRLPAWLPLLALVFLGAPRAAETVVVKGVADWNAGVTLPPGAVLEVTIENAGEADMPARILGSQRLADPGPPPRKFRVKVEPGTTGREDWSARATIRAGDRLLFVSDRFHPVVFDALDGRVAIQMSAAEPLPPQAELEGTEWKLVRLGKRAIPVQEGRRRDPYLVLSASDGQVRGFSGCNHFRGQYLLEGDRLTFGELAGTRMACATGMELETWFLRTLQNVRRWRIEGRELQLMDENERVIARLLVAKGR